MKFEEKELKSILKFLNDQRGFNFNGYRIPMLQRRLQKRVFATKSTSLQNYYEFLRENPTEMDNLIDVFTINVSHFFRNSLSFEYITKIIIPALVWDKEKENDNSLRLWSASCSFGEEPYSMAIILNEFFRKEDISIKLNIFATDIDKKALNRASEGYYNFESIKKVKYGIFEKHFTKEGDRFKLDPEIMKMVKFSFHDLLDKNRLVPPDSIFGSFDMVLCRNVLIYFEPEYQKIIFNKLYKSLNPKGYLVLGEAEVPVEGFRHKFRRENKYCKIYRKIG